MAVCSHAVEVAGEESPLSTDEVVEKWAEVGVTMAGGEVVIAGFVFVCTVGFAGIGTAFCTGKEGTIECVGLERVVAGPEVP